MQVSPSDKYVVVHETFVEQLQLRDVQTLQIQRTFEALSSNRLFSCFLPGNRLAAGCRDDTVRVWDVESVAIETTLQCPSGWLVYFTASPAGQLLTVERESGSLSAILWRSLTAPEPELLASNVICWDGTYPVSFTLNGTLAACVCIDTQSTDQSHTVRLYDVTTATAQLLKCFRIEIYCPSIAFIGNNHVLLHATDHLFRCPQMKV